MASSGDEHRDKGDLATGAAAPGGLWSLILAAGAGRRFGGGKLMAPWRGGRLIDGALAAAFAAPGDGVILVTGADPDVADHVRAWARTHGATARLILAHAPDHAEGMGASLRAGVAALPADCAGVFVFLGDMPRVPEAMAPALAAALSGGALAAAPVFAGRRGHPVLFGADLFPLLAQARGDEGARGALAALGDRLVLAESPDDGVLFDVDTPAALG